MQGAPIIINVKTRDGISLKKGEEAVVYGQDKETGDYLVASLKLKKERRNQFYRGWYGKKF